MAWILLRASTVGFLKASLEHFLFSTTQSAVK
jgi:hypothetical protein